VLKILGSRPLVFRAGEGEGREEGVAHYLNYTIASTSWQGVVWAYTESKLHSTEQVVTGKAERDANG